MASGNYPDIGPTTLIKHYSMFHFDVGSMSAANCYTTVSVTLNKRWPNYCLLGGRIVMKELKMTVALSHPCFKP